MNSGKLNTKEIIFISALIFISASPLFENFEKILFSYVALLLMYFFKRKFITSFYDIAILLIFLFIYIIYSPILDIVRGVSVDFSTGLGFFSLILVSFICSGFFSRDDFLKINELFVRYTLIIGLPIWLFVINASWALDFIPSYTFGNSTHNTLIIVNFLVIDGILTTRFTGFGREPGLIQLFYLLALWYRLNTFGKFIDKYSLLIILAIFLGRSTAGLFAMICILFISLPRGRSLKYTLIILPLFIFYLIDEFTYHINNKMFGTESFSFRYDRYLDFFSSELINIFIGYGSGYYSAIIAPLGIGGWDTLLQYSQRYGLLAFCLLCAVVIYSNINYSLISLILLLTFISQSIWFYPAVCFFYFKNRFSRA